MKTLLVAFVCALVVCSVVHAQEQEWSMPPSAPPLGPPVTPAPVAPVIPQEVPIANPRIPEKVAPAPAPPAVAPEPPISDWRRLGFTFKFLPGSVLLNIGASGLLFPSVRTGLRWALLPRVNHYAQANFSVALEVGLDGVPALPRTLYGVGITARVGFSPVTRGGMFMPFADVYALGILTLVPSRPTLAFPRLGIGASFNLFALLNGGAAGGVVAAGLIGSRWHPIALLALALLIPNVELVWTPATTGTSHVLELRLGIGF